MPHVATGVGFARFCTLSVAVAGNVVETAIDNVWQPATRREATAIVQVAVAVVGCRKGSCRCRKSDNGNDSVFPTIVGKTFKTELPFKKRIAVNVDFFLSYNL